METQFSTEFLKQLVQRFRVASPKFYQIIANYSGGILLFALAVKFGLGWVINTLLPGMHSTVPLWLSFTYSQFSELMGYVAAATGGSFVIAKTTVQTPATPPLLTSEDKKAADVATAQVKDNQLAIMQQAMLAQQQQIVELQQRLVTPSAPVQNEQPQPNTSGVSGTGLGSINGTSLN